MTRLIKTTHSVQKNGLYLIKKYYDDGIVKIYAHIGHRIRLIEVSKYPPNELN